MKIEHFALALILYYSLHSILATPKVKKVIFRFLIPHKLYRLFYNIVSAGLLIPVYLIYTQIPKTAILESSYWTLIPGWVVILLGAGLLYIAFSHYDKSEFLGTDRLKSPGNTSREVLNTQGLNQFVRHPLYFASLLLFWGFFLTISNNAMLVLAVISTIYIYIGTKLEERKLVREFGDAYLRYKVEVPMLIPKLFCNRC